MSVICEIFQSHELKWQVKDCEPIWNQNDQKTVLHNFNVYPDLDFVDAYGNSTYVKYTGADKIRELLLEIHKVICNYVNSKNQDSNSKNEALELPAGGSNLPAVQGSKEVATTQKPGLPAVQAKPGLPAVQTKPGLPATIPYDANQYLKEPDQEDQKLLPAPMESSYYCLTMEDETKVVHLIEFKTGEEPKPESLIGQEIEDKGKVKLASGPYKTLGDVEKECTIEEKPKEDCCNYYVTITTTKLRMIEEGSGEKNINFRYLMSNNMLKDIGDDKISNADKFKITITPASTGLSKLFGTSFEMKLEEFQIDDPNYPGNLIVAIVPTLDLQLSGNESLAATHSAKTYNEVSARELKRRISELEFSERSKTMTQEQRDAEFRKILTKWEEDERRDKA